MRTSKISWEVRFAAGLIVVALAINYAHFLVFRDAHHIYLWNLTSLAFLPVSVFVLTLFVDRALDSRERVRRLDKLNMLSGAFFSAVGTSLLARCAAWDPAIGNMRSTFGSPDGWQRLTPRQVRDVLAAHVYAIRADAAGLTALRSLLLARQDFLLRLIENPNLGEHQTFSAMLRAVFHLSEELALRDDLAAAERADLQHLAGDVERAYGHLAREWAAHVRYLQQHYPYLFSLAVRTNPFDPDASPVVKVNAER